MCELSECDPLFMTGLNVPPPLRAGLLGPRVVSPHPQGLQGSHLNLSQTSAQRHRTYFLLNNKAVKRVARRYASQFARDADADAAAGTTAAAGRAAAPASGRIEPARREGADLTRPTGRPRRRAHVALSKPSATPLRLPSRRLPCSLVAQAIDS